MKLLIHCSHINLRCKDPSPKAIHLFISFFLFFIFYLCVCVCVCVCEDFKGYTCFVGIELLMGGVYKLKNLS